MKILRCFRVRRRLLQLWRHFPSSWRRRFVGHRDNDHHRLLKIACRKFLNWGTALLGQDRKEYQRLRDIKRRKRRKPSRGHFAVYVGGDVDRFEVPIAYVNHPLFQELLKQAEEEFGYDHPDAITLPCPLSHFQNVRSLIRYMPNAFYP